MKKPLDVSLAAIQSDLLVDATLQHESYLNFNNSTSKTPSVISPIVANGVKAKKDHKLAIATNPRFPDSK